MEFVLVGRFGSIQACRCRFSEASGLRVVFYILVVFSRINLHFKAGLMSLTWYESIERLSSCFVTPMKIG